MSHASSSSLKRKRNSKKRNIKSRKIDKRERKMLVSKRSIILRLDCYSPPLLGKRLGYERFLYQLG